MLKQYVGSLSSTPSDTDMNAGLAPLTSPPSQPPVRDDIAADAGTDAGAIAQAARDQLARELADIETATAALRRAEPALESWTTAPANTPGKPRPVWLLIGVLWLSTAIVTAGAVVAIATLAG
jgi:hypothetical protein